MGGSLLWGPPGREVLFLQLQGLGGRGLGQPVSVLQPQYGGLSLLVLPLGGRVLLGVRGGRPIVGLRRGLCSRQTAQGRSPGAQTPSGSLGDTVGRCGDPSVCLYHRGDRGPGWGRAEGWPNWGSCSLCPDPSLTALPAGCRPCPSSCACYDSTGAQDQAPEAAGSRGVSAFPGQQQAGPGL